MEINQQPTFFNKVSSFFKKKPASADPAIPAENQNVDNETSPPEWISIYGHGFHNGVYRIEEEHDSFPSYLNNCNQLDEIIELQNLNNKELGEHKAKLDIAQSDLIRYTEEKIEATEKVIMLQDCIEREASDSNKISDRNNELFQKREHTKPEYGWIPALFFLCAGVIFIWGDITVTADIVSTGFDMKEEDGRLFAIGLACTAFLIKPLLDRMFEKPFQKAGFDLKKVHKILLITTTILGLIMLLFLGQFRADAKSAVNKIAENDIKLEAQDISPSDETQLKLESSDIGKKLAENNWGRWGIVLSTLIFAIGGAMCLSVAFPSLTDLCNRYWFIPFRRWLNKILIRRIDKKLQTLRNIYENYLIKSKNAASKLDTLDIDALKDVFAQIKGNQIDLINRYYQIRQGKENDLYKDGLNRGLKYSLEGDLKFKIFDPMKLNGKKDNNEVHSNLDNENGIRKYTRRPFVKIRKMIADNYNKKQHNSTQDGTEFEILS